MFRAQPAVFGPMVANAVTAIFSPATLCRTFTDSTCVGIRVPRGQPLWLCVAGLSLQSS